MTHPVKIIVHIEDPKNEPPAWKPYLAEQRFGFKFRLCEDSGLKEDEPCPKCKNQDLFTGEFGAVCWECRRVFNRCYIPSCKKLMKLLGWELDGKLTLGHWVPSVDEGEEFLDDGTTFYWKCPKCQGCGYTECG
jgi:hypothetical protein